MRPALVIVLCATALTAAAEGVGELLYNGIEIPDEWSPARAELTREPLPEPPYLAEPPPVIPIDVGRQLFVDDFLVGETDLTRTYHAAEYYPGNPVLAPDKPWEVESKFPTAMPFSDGVWYDPADGLHKMWYMGGYTDCTCYATSTDGIHWEKPELDVVPGTNIVHQAGRDSSTVWLDLEEPDPSRRYKMWLYQWPENSDRMTGYFSPDGIHWGEPAIVSGPTGDRSSVFFNPFRGVWVYSIREYFPASVGRCRRYSEDPDPIEAAKWGAGEAALWIGADSLDPKRDDLGTPCQLYNLDCVAYESILLGLFSIWRGQPQDRAKPNEIVLGYSRDGFHWHRPVRSAFIPVSEAFGDWNWGNVQSAGGGCLVVGEKLRFYVSGRSGVEGSSGSGTSATGLATLRRDGFCSMDAVDEEGVLTTRPVTFSGKRLFVNAEAEGGEIRVEVLDEAGNVLRPPSRPVRTDSTLAPVTWKGTEPLAKLAGTPVRFRFTLQNARLYSFWVSPDESGASQGYVAAGGPGFTGTTDTVGREQLRETK